MRVCLLVLLSLFLAACGAAEQKVTYEPPAGGGGQLCTNQCHLAQDYCDEGCGYKYRQCVSDVQAQAMKDYDKYTREQFAANQAIDLNYSDFVRLQPCNTSQKTCTSNCEARFGMCYTGCGGTRTTTAPSCQFLCF